MINAQSSHQIFEHLTTEHGLSSDKVEGIIQDRDGFYWIATQNGLNRFDGTSFKIFRHSERDSSSLTHNYCTTLLEGKDGDIWVATHKGVSRYVKSKGAFQPLFLSHPSRNFEISNRIYNLTSDKDGNIWIAGNGLWKYDVVNDRVQLFKKDHNDASTILDYTLITQIAYDRGNNGIWFTTGREISFFSINENVFYHKKHNPRQWGIFEKADGNELAIDSLNRIWFREMGSQSFAYFIPNENRIHITGKKIAYGIKQLSTDDQNRLWIFYWQAAAEIFDPRTGSSDSGFFAPRHKYSSLSQKASSLFIDRHHHYWISSDQGISIYREANQFYKLYKFQSGRNDRDKEPLKITAIAQTKPDWLWIGTNDGLFEYSLVTNLSKEVLSAPKKSVISVLYPESNTLWMGVGDEAIGLDIHKEIISRKFTLLPGVFHFQKGANDELWVGHWNSGLHRINLSTGEQTHFVRKHDPNSIHSVNLIAGLYDDPLYWVGYNAGSGFSSFDVRSGVWTHHHPQQQNLSNANAGTITVITKGDSTLWLGTHGAGIFHFDPVKNTYLHYQQENGLNSNYVNSIVPDNNGHLWISTADGLNYLNVENSNIRSLNIGMVFPDNDFAANSAIGLNGNLFFFCKNEIIEIDPKAYLPDDQFAQLVVSNFKIFDQDVAIHHQDEIRLSHDENFFSFSFSAVRTNPIRDISYAYMLEGFDKQWNFTNRPQADYTNVPDGKYAFRVKVANDEGKWSDALISIPVRVQPPYWGTWWFISLVIIAIISLAYAFHKYQITQVKRLYTVRTQISRDLHDDIGASLSSINIYSSVAEGEVNDNPQKAREFLQQINTSSRQVMENISDIVWANHTNKHEEATFAGRIKNYGYELLAQQNIDCEYRIDPHAERKLSRPEARRNILMIIKEALHNITKYSGATDVEVSVMIHGAELHVSVRDNGKGFDPSVPRGGNGLKNMRQRAEALGGTFRVDAVADAGTTVIAKIPLANISDR